MDDCGCLYCVSARDQTVWINVGVCGCPGCVPTGVQTAQLGVKRIQTSIPLPWAKFQRTMGEFMVETIILSHHRKKLTQQMSEDNEDKRRMTGKKMSGKRKSMGW